MPIAMVIFQTKKYLKITFKKYFLCSENKATLAALMHIFTVVDQFAFITYLKNMVLLTVNRSVTFSLSLKRHFSQADFLKLL